MQQGKKKNLKKAICFVLRTIIIYVETSNWNTSFHEQGSRLSPSPTQNREEGEEDVTVTDAEEASGSEQKQKPPPSQEVTERAVLG